MRYFRDASMLSLLEQSYIRLYAVVYYHKFITLCRVVVVISGVAVAEVAVGDGGWAAGGCNWRCGYFCDAGITTVAHVKLYPFLAVYYHKLFQLLQ